MQTYRITEKVARFGVGQKFALKQDQASARSHALEVLDKQRGIYRSIQAVEFKAGEEIGLDGTVPKSLAEIVMTPERADAKAAEKAAAKAKKPAAKRKPAAKKAA